MVNSTGEKVNNDSHGSQRLCFAHRNIPGADQLSVLRVSGQ